MARKIYTAPATEPISLTELKLHLRLDSTSFGDDLSSAQSIAPGSHAIAAAYSLAGSSVDVLSYSALALLESGTNGAGGTVDVKLQHRNDAADAWEDVASGAFTQVTTSNDNANYELSYTGGKRYLRAVSTVAGAACVFGVTILLDAATTAEDDLLTSLIKAARTYCEYFQNRAYITQTWDLWLDSFPSADFIKIPLPPLQSVTHIKYYGTDNTEYTMTVTDYFVDTVSEPGRVSLGYSKTWPTTTLRPVNAVNIRFVAGYGVASAVPENIKQAQKLLCGYWHENREAAMVGSVSREIEFAVHALLWQERIIPV